MPLLRFGRVELERAHGKRAERKGDAEAGQHVGVDVGIDAPVALALVDQLCNEVLTGSEPLA